MLDLINASRTEILLLNFHLRMWIFNFTSPLRQSPLLLHYLITAKKCPVQPLKSFSHPTSDSVNSPAINSPAQWHFWTCFYGHQMHHDPFFFSLASIFLGKKQLCAVCIAWGFTDTQPSQKMPILCSWRKARVKTQTFIDGEGQFQAEIWFLLEQRTALISSQLPWRRHHS